MNSPGNEKSRTDFAWGNGEARRVNRLPALACFTAVAALHVVFLSVFDFSADNRKAVTETRELFLTLDFPESGPEEAEELALPAAPETPPPAPPLPSEEIVPPEAAPVGEAALEEVPLSPEEYAAAPPDEAAPAAALPALTGGAAANAGDEGAFGPAPARKAPMTDAEYLALIMGRLEKNKIYPLSVRKRGIEGDIRAAFTIRRDGTVADMRLADPSGHRFLAQAAFETIRSASPFPVMEGREGDYTIQVSIRYRLEDGGL
jgi:protein TonB